MEQTNQLDTVYRQEYFKSEEGKAQILACKYEPLEQVAYELSVRIFDDFKASFKGQVDAVEKEGTATIKLSVSLSGDSKQLAEAIAKVNKTGGTQFLWEQKVLHTGNDYQVQACAAQEKARVPEKTMQRAIAVKTLKPFVERLLQQNTQHTATQFKIAGEGIRASGTTIDIEVQVDYDPNEANSVAWADKAVHLYHLEQDQGKIEALARDASVTAVAKEVANQLWDKLVEAELSKDVASLFGSKELTLPVTYTIQSADMKIFDAAVQQADVGFTPWLQVKIDRGLNVVEQVKESEEHVSRSLIYQAMVPTIHQQLEQRAAEYADFELKVTDFKDVKSGRGWGDSYVQISFNVTAKRTAAEPTLKGYEPIKTAYLPEAEKAEEGQGERKVAKRQVFQ